jgi:hypothetical protein
MIIIIIIVMEINFATSKNLTVEGIPTMFPHSNIHKYTCTSPDGKLAIKVAISDRQGTVLMCT